MGGTSIIHSFISARIETYKPNLVPLSDGELVQMVKDGNTYVTCRNRESHSCFGTPSGFEVYLFSDAFYEGAAASRILEERHGLDYVLRISGLRSPRTLREKIGHLFTLRYPKL